MKLEEIMKTKQQIIQDGHQLENEMIRGVSINVSGHFYGTVSIQMWTGCCCLLHDYNNIRNIGYIIHAIGKLLDLDTDDSGFDFCKIKDVPIRIISDGAFSKVLGFGNFMNDKFVYTEDLRNLDDV